MGSNHGKLCVVILDDCVLGPHEIDGSNLIRLICAGVPAENTAMREGVGCFVGRSLNLNGLKHPVRKVASGQINLGPTLTARFAAAVVKSAGPSSSEIANNRTEDMSEAAVQAQLTNSPSLSPRQYHVLRCHLSGMSVANIAVKFPRSPTTIKTRKRLALHKVGISSDAELLAVREPLENS